MPAPSEQAVSVGETITGVTSQTGEWHRYRLTATQGQIVFLDALGDCVPGLSWQLLRPDGALSAFATTCTDSDARTLDVAGNWVIEVYSDTMATGGYDFTVRRAP